MPKGCPLGQVFYPPWKTVGQAGPVSLLKSKKPPLPKGDIRVDLDPGSYAEKYTRAGAAAISILTEEHFSRAVSTIL